MAENAFKVYSYQCYDKHIEIEGPGELRISVDYDDVWHPEVDAWIEWVCLNLNRAYKATPPVLPIFDDQICECGKMTNKQCELAKWQDCGA